MDPYAELVPGSSDTGGEVDASADPYAALIPKRGATGTSPPTDTDPYSALVPKVPAAAGGYPTAKKQIDPLAAPALTEYLTQPLADVISGAKNLIGTGLQGIGALSQTAGPLINIPLPGGTPPEETQARREATPVEESPLFQAGQAVQDFGKGALAPTPAWQASPVRRFASDIASGFGSLVGGLATGVALGPEAAGLLFTMAGSGEAAQNAQQAQATPEQLHTAAKYGTIAGGTDMADMLLLNLGSAGKAAGLLKKVGLTAVSAALEGGQEGFQQFLQNLISKGVYDPNKDVMDQVGYNALVGAIVGGAAHPVLSHFEGGPSKAPTTEEINNYFTGLVGSAGAPPAAPAGVTAPRAAPTEAAPTPIAPTELPAELGAGEPPPPKGPEDYFPGRPTETPPAAPAPAPAPEGGQNIDIGSGYTIEKGADPKSQWTLTGPEGPIVSAPNFADIAKLASDELGRNELPTAKVPKVEPTGGGVVTFRQPEAQYVANNGSAVDPERARRMAYSWLTNTKKMDTQAIESLRTQSGGDVVVAANSAGWDLVKPVPKKSAAAPAPAAPVVTNKTVSMDPKIVDFLSKKRPKLKAPKVEPTAPVDPNAPLKESGTVELGSGADHSERMLKILGLSLYGKPEDMSRIAVKELFQNSFDAVKAMLQRGMGLGKIAFNVDERSHSIRIYDNGAGMNPKILEDAFFKPAGTYKEGTDSSGGYGFAKMVYMYGNKGLRVVTMRDGKVYELTTDGVAIHDWINKKGPPPRVTYRTPTAKDLEFFPQGHGTAIEMKLPHDYYEKGIKTEIPMNPYIFQHESLTNSPLFANIDVTFNDQKVMGAGTAFPIEDYTPVVKFKGEWGTATLIATKDVPKGGVDYHNLTYLSNGIYQFSDALRLGGSGSARVPRHFFLDIQSSAKPEDFGYPFEINRQSIRAAHEKDFQQILAHVSMLYRFEMLRNDATNFGQMHYLKGENADNYEKSGQIKIEPEKPAVTHVSNLHLGDTAVIKKGKLFVEGKPLQTLNVEELEKNIPDVNTLKVPPEQIRSDQVMIHDNTIVKISDVEKKGLVQLAEEKFGRRFDVFMLDIGNAFHELRDVVAKTMGYSELSQEALGLSFDVSYRGVSIRLPFSGSFINPAVPEYSDPLRAAVGMIGTMVHEFAHHKVRSHNAEFPAEMQRLIINLDTHPEFDFHAFKQKVVNSVASNKDIFDYINGFYSGAYNLESRGKRFEDLGSNEARDVGPSGAVGEARGGGLGGTSISGPVAPSTGALAEGAGRGEFGRRVAEDRSVDNLTLEDHRNMYVMRQIDSGLEPTFPQPEVQAIMDGMIATFQAVSLQRGGGGVPPNVRQMAAHANKMNKMFKWAWGLDRLVDQFPTFGPLKRYAERIREMRLDTSKIQDGALRIAKAWRSLGKDAEPLSALIDDMANMTYRTPAETKKGIVRYPTQAEFEALVKQHGVSKQALDVFGRQKQFFTTFLDLITQNAKDTAIRTIQDPVALAAQLDRINTQNAELKKRPYFPFTRFGSHFITVRDAAGKVVFFQTYERRGPVSAERIQQRELAKITASAPQGHTIEHGVLPETAAPFVGLPPELLESIATELNLTQKQREALDQIRYQNAPASSFVHHWQNKNYTPGYSHDFLRAFSRYAFHGARYYSRVKYAWALRDEIKAARATGGNQAGTIANYMDDHLQNTVLDAKGDFGWAKGAVFLWVFGYSPMGAAINISQVPMISYPFLAAKFGGLGVGDARATKSLVKAMTQLSSFYKRGKYDNMTEFEMRALDYGVKSGRITEAMASELAGLAQGENLLGLGNSKIGRGFQMFMEKAAFLFEMSEQFNRRVTYRAALDLAMKYPNSLAVKEALNKYPEEYNQLLGKNFNQAEAAAIVTAAHSTEQTQFVYARETRPRFMRGRLAGTLFVFKTYMLNVLQLLGANKSSVMPRYIIMMMLLGGLMGLPGADDLVDISEQLGKWLFGKDFKTKLALRELILNVADGKIPPDLVLHGLARKGFGIPALVDMAGEHPGRGLGGVADTMLSRANYQQYVQNMKMKGGTPISFQEFIAQHSQNVPMPVTDMSKSLGMGRLLPFDLGKMVDPNGDPNAAIAATAQQASGAIFSVGFNLYKALQDSKVPASDWKRWERVMPRAMASASRAYRAYNEGRERAHGGTLGSPTIVKYDARDPEQAAEIIAMAAGFMPARQSAQWDSIMAQAELIGKYKYEKELLYGQMFEAQLGKNKEEIGRVRTAIIDFNKGLPQWAKSESITSDALHSSMMARAKSQQMREAGIPTQRGAVPVARHVQGLFPESVVDVRRISE